MKVRYGKRLENYIPIKKILDTNMLQNLLILRAPQATNFLVSKDEAEAIASLMDPHERPQV